MENSGTRRNRNPLAAVFCLLRAASLAVPMLVFGAFAFLFAGAATLNIYTEGDW